MTLYELLMILGGIILVALVVKGFRAGNRVQAMEQPDNGRNYYGGSGLP